MASPASLTHTTLAGKMEKPHKAHHKPAAGTKHDKKDKAKGVDRSQAKGYNPKVSSTLVLHSLARR